MKLLRSVICFSTFALIFSLFVTMPLDRVNGQNGIISNGSKEKISFLAKNKEFCSSNNWNNGDKVPAYELRELTVSSTGKLNVDGATNGGVSVIGENRSDVLVRACVQTWGASDAEARSLASSITIDLGGTIKAGGPAASDWSVSYEIRTPRDSNLDLRAQNGGISIKGVSGSMDIATVNGGVSVIDAAGSVHGRTTNGGINVSLVGSGWNGSGLDLETTNGGVNLTIPANFAANVEVGTVNGGFSSDFPGLRVEKAEKAYGLQPKRVNADINGGGAKIRVVTTNGGIRISSNDGKY